MKNKIKYKKSNHKHLYDDCLLVCAEFADKVIKGQYCKECGKLIVGELLYISPIQKDSYSYKTMNEDEAKAEHPHLPLFHINNVFQKYVDEEELI